MKRRLRALVCSVVCVCLGWVGSAYGDAVTDWSAIAVDALNAAVPPRPGPTGLLDMAVVQLAVHNAVAAIDGRFQPYYLTIAGASGSPVAATAKAAHDVLVNRFPTQAASLDSIYDNYLSANNLAQDDPGVAVGQAAAAGIIALRADDGSFPSPAPSPYTGGTDNGVWRPTPAPFAPMAVPWLAHVRPFALDNPWQLRAGPPPSLTSDRYTQDYNEVKALGALFNSTRTPQQTDLAYFWAANYLAVWNEAVRNLARDNVYNIGESARLFALFNMAMADGSITAWSTKTHYAFWRPYTAIQEGDNDGNDYTTGDPNWLPLIDNPPYPDYTSGANNVTGAVTRMLQLYFGRDELTFPVTTNNALATHKTRIYNRFSDAASDVVNCRVYEGIHFRFADEIARSQGEAIADWAFTRFLRPLDSHDNDGHE